MQLCSVNLTGSGAKKGFPAPAPSHLKSFSIVCEVSWTWILCNILGPVKLAQSLVCCGFISNDLGHIGLCNNSLMSETPR